MNNACKIILIILLGLFTLRDIFMTIITERNEQFKWVVRLVVGKTLWWLFFLCVGILNFN